MKKILSLALAGVMMFSALPMAYAADVDYTAGTAVEYTADADANRSYTITVPAKLIPKQDAAVSGTVTLKGKWASNETVKVTADAEVELTNSINAEDKHKLAITFAGIEKAGDNTEEKTYTETVSVAAMPAAALFGEWTGKFNYNVEFSDGIERISFTIDGTEYQAEEGMTWSKWIVSDYNTGGIFESSALVLINKNEELHQIDKGDGAACRASETILVGQAYTTKKI